MVSPDSKSQLTQVHDNRCPSASVLAPKNARYFISYLLLIIYTELSSRTRKGTHRRCPPIRCCRLPFVAGCLPTEKAFISGCVLTPISDKGGRMSSYLSLRRRVRWGEAPATSKAPSPSAFIRVHLRFHMLGVLCVRCGRALFFRALRVFFGGAVVVRDPFPVVSTGFPASRE